MKPAIHTILGLSCLVKMQILTNNFRKALTVRKDVSDLIPELVDRIVERNPPFINCFLGRIVEVIISCHRSLTLLDVVILDESNNSDKRLSHYQPSHSCREIKSNDEIRNHDSMSDDRWVIASLSVGNIPATHAKLISSLNDEMV